MLPHSFHEELDKLVPCERNTLEEKVEAWKAHWNMLRKNCKCLKGAKQYCHRLLKFCPIVVPVQDALASRLHELKPSNCHESIGEAGVQLLHRFKKQFGHKKTLSKVKRPNNSFSEVGLLAG